MTPSEEKALVALSYLFEKEKSRELFSYLDEEAQNNTNRYLDEILSMSEGQRKEWTYKVFKSLNTPSLRHNFLSQVHPDWLYEELKNESPALIASLLRYLPGDKVQMILDKLDSQTLSALPSLQETFSLDEALVQTIQDEFQVLFQKSSDTEVHHLKEKDYLKVLKLSSQEIESFMKNLGLNELAMAFIDLNEKLRNLIVQRLGSREAILLKERFKSQDKAPEIRQKQAQGHLLDLDIKNMDASSFLRELGLFVYSKAIQKEDLNYFEAVEKTFAFSLSSSLREKIEKNIDLNTGRLVKKYQDEITDALNDFLAKKDK